MVKGRESAREFEKLFSMVSGALDDISNLAAQVRGLLEKLLECSSFDAFSSSISAAAPTAERPPEGVHASPGLRDTSLFCGESTFFYG